MAQASKVAKSVEIEMAHNKTTKNFERYEAEAEAAVVQNVYIAKSALGEPRPDIIVVTIKGK